MRTASNIAKKVILDLEIKLESLNQSIERTDIKDLSALILSSKKAIELINSIGILFETIDNILKRSQDEDEKQILKTSVDSIIIDDKKDTLNNEDLKQKVDQLQNLYKPYSKKQVNGNNDNDNINHQIPQQKKVYINRRPWWRGNFRPNNKANIISYLLLTAAAGGGLAYILNK
jgi:hypothetical protein